MSYFFKSIISYTDNPGIKLVVFDFDGTIADTRELVLRIISKHLLSFEVKLTERLVGLIGDTPLEKYISSAGIPSPFVRSVVATIQEDYYKEYHKIKPCKNLMALKSIKAHKVIVSNNITFFIEKALNSLRANFFDGVYGSDQFKDKVSMIKSLAKKYRASPSEIMYVGDKAIDVKIAREIGCYSVAIGSKSSWSSRKDLSNEKPDYLLTDLGKIPLAISNLDMKQIPSI